MGTAERLLKMHGNDVTDMQEILDHSNADYTGNFCDEEEEEVAALAGGREDCEFTLLKDPCAFSDMPAGRACRSGATNLWSRGAGQEQRRNSGQKV